MNSSNLFRRKHIKTFFFNIYILLQDGVTFKSVVILKAHRVFYCYYYLMKREKKETGKLQIKERIDFYNSYMLNHLFKM